MKRLFPFILLTLLIALTALSAFAQEIITEENILAEMKKRVDIDKTNLAIVIGVVDKNGERYYKYGTFSRKDKTAVDEDTIFEIGSISKTFTGILLADMHLKGEVNVNDPLGKYLPESVKVPELNGKKITLLSLTVQNSSLPSLPTNYKPKDFLNPYEGMTVKTLYDFLNSYELTREPGEKFEYSNLGVGLLGHVLALKAGMSYEQLVKERILDPLEMHDTRITLSEEDLARTATPNSTMLYPVKLWDLPALAGAGALRSTAKDMVKYLKANLGLTDSRIKESLELSHKDIEEISADGMRIGYNWITSNVDGTKIIWHNGGTGGFRTFAGFVKEKGMGVVVWTNCQKSAEDLGTKLLVNAK